MQQQQQQQAGVASPAPGVGTPGATAAGPGRMPVRPGGSAATTGTVSAADMSTEDAQKRFHMLGTQLSAQIKALTNKLQLAAGQPGAVAPGSEERTRIQNEIVGKQGQLVKLKQQYNAFLVHRQQQQQAAAAAAAGGVGQVRPPPPQQQQQQQQQQAGASGVAAATAAAAGAAQMQATGSQQGMPAGGAGVGGSQMASSASGQGIGRPGPPGGAAATQAFAARTGSAGPSTPTIPQGGAGVPVRAGTPAQGGGGTSSGTATPSTVRNANMAASAMSVPATLHQQQTIPANLDHIRPSAGINQPQAFPSTKGARPTLNQGLASANPVAATPGLLRQPERGALGPGLGGPGNAAQAAQSWESLLGIAPDRSAASTLAGPSSLGAAGAANDDDPLIDSLGLGGGSAGAGGAGGAGANGSVAATGAALLKPTGRLVEKRKIQELIGDIDPTEVLEGDVEDVSRPLPSSALAKRTGGILLTSVHH